MLKTFNMFLDVLDKQVEVKLDYYPEEPEVLWPVDVYSPGSLEEYSVFSIMTEDGVEVIGTLAPEDEKWLVYKLEEFLATLREEPSYD